MNLIRILQQRAAIKRSEHFLNLRRHIGGAISPCGLAALVVADRLRLSPDGKRLAGTNPFGQAIREHAEVSWRWRGA
jgi:hypothetical protein